MIKSLNYNKLAIYGLVALLFYSLFLVKTTINSGCFYLSSIILLSSIPIAYSIYVILSLRKKYWMSMIFKDESSIKKLIKKNGLIILSSTIIGILLSFLLISHVFIVDNPLIFTLLIAPVIFPFFIEKLTLKRLDDELNSNLFEFIRILTVLGLFSFTLFSISLGLNILDAIFFNKDYIPFVDSRIYEEAIAKVKHSCKLFKFYERIEYIKMLNLYSLKNVETLPSYLIIIINLFVLSLKTYTSATLYLFGVYKILNKVFTKLEKRGK